MPEITTGNRVRIRARYSETTPDQHPSVYAYALKVEILSTDGPGDHLFVFQRLKADEFGNNTDEFIQIASPLDIEETPEDAPDLQNNMPYYRKKDVLLWFRCPYDLKLARKKIEDDLQTLALTYNTLESGFDTTEEKTYG